MSALDICEPQVIRAIEKDGWVIRRKPYYIQTDTKTLFVDCIFERLINGITERIIIVEVKCFRNEAHDLQELYTAIGQYAVYRAALSTEGVLSPFYLAIPDDAYQRLTEDATIRLAFEQVAIQFVIVNLESEAVVSWVS